MDWSHGIFASDRLVRFEELEYSVPREHAVAALRAARGALERHAVSFPIELRFSAGDDALLSPAHGRDSAWIAVHMFKGMAFEPAFRDVEAALSALDGRPHWGKRSFLSAHELAPRYPRWDAFQAARVELDPDGRFANAWVREVLDERRTASEEGLALTSVGRDGVDDLAARDQVDGVEALAQLTRLGVAEPDAVADLQPGGRLAGQRRLHLARALARVEPQPGG